MQFSREQIYRSNVNNSLLLRFRHFLQRWFDEFTFDIVELNCQFIDLKRTKSSTRFDARSCVLHRNLVYGFWIRDRSGSPRAFVIVCEDPDRVIWSELESNASVVSDVQRRSLVFLTITHRTEIVQRFQVLFDIVLARFETTLLLALEIVGGHFHDQELSERRRTLDYETIDEHKRWIRTRSFRFFSGVKPKRFFFSAASRASTRLRSRSAFLRAFFSSSVSARSYRWTSLSHGAAAAADRWETSSIKCHAANSTGHAFTEREISVLRLSYDDAFDASSKSISVER